MIRILHVIGSLNIGGSQTMIMNIYRNIDRRKIQFDFIVDHPEQLYFADEIYKMGGKIYFMPTFKFVNFLKVKKMWRDFFNNHKEYKILHSHVRSYAFLYLPIAKKCGLKTIIHSHSTSNGKGILAGIKNILQYPLRYQANYFFGCSQKAGLWLFGKKIVRGSKYYRIPNAIDLEKYKFRGDIREKYKFNLDLGNGRIFIHVGRLHPAKNHFFLLDIFAEWVKKYPEDVLLIVGEGELRTKIEKKINELKLEESIKMLGSRDDIPFLLQVADCFLFPSKWEGLPVTVIEAQAAGLPCIISTEVTDEVCITPLIIKIPINNGIQCWIETMDRLDYKRKDVRNNIRQAGFDINTTSNWLRDFYIKISEDKNEE